MGCLMAGILILASDKTPLIIHHHMGRKKINQLGLTLKECAGLAQLSLWVLRSDLNTQLLDLFVGNSGHASTSN